LLTKFALSADALAGVLAQSADCVKLIGLDGDVLWMNPNGMCAMEIDDIDEVRGQAWEGFWPAPARASIADALPAAAAGEIVRFDAFCPTAKGTPRWWNVTVSSVTGTDGELAGYLAISRDVTEAETGRQALLVAAAELRHRLKNTYAMIGSLLNGFARGNESHEEFAREMESRLISLSAAQSLFSTDDVPRDIATLIPALVEPFATPNCPIALGAITPVAVPQGQADAIALALGELAVNSAKHGALRGGGGISLRAAASASDVEIVWAETSQIPVAAHARSGGQGLKLIERIVRARMGEIEIAWHEHGLRVRVTFPRA
jgi:PAS domain S-box-containing protein